MKPAFRNILRRNIPSHGDLMATLQSYRAMTTHRSCTLWIYVTLEHGWFVAGDTELIAPELDDCLRVRVTILRHDTNEDLAKTASMLITSMLSTLSDEDTYDHR